MKFLSDYASNMYSQYGEDGMIEEILRRIGQGPGTCVEFGAANGVDCSNTAKLWRHEGWEALLIEADGNHINDLNANAEGYNVTIKGLKITPGNVDAAIGSWHDPVDLISIDVDGNDFFIFCSMHIRTKVLIVEYNKTIPPWQDLVPVQEYNQMGIGSLTLSLAAQQRGYTLLGLTKSNCIFVDTQYAPRFLDIEKDLFKLQPPESFTTLATDMNGQMIALGKEPPPWGLVWPPTRTQFQPNQPGLLTITSKNDIQRLVNGVEELRYIQKDVGELRSAAMQIAEEMQKGTYNRE